MRYVDTIISVRDCVGYDSLLAEGEVVVRVDSLPEETIAGRASGALWEGEQKVRVWIENRKIAHEPV